MSFSACLVVFVLSLIKVCFSYKILMTVGFNPSHLMYFSELGKNLIRHGHHVTLVRPERMTVSASLATSGIDFRSFQGDLDISTEEMETMFMDLAFDYSSFKNIRTLMIVNEAIAQEALSIYKDKELINDLENEKFDFMVIDVAQTHAILPYRLGVPFGILGADCPNWCMRSPDIPSYVPALISSYSERMTFTERFLNVLYHIAMATYWTGGRNDIAKYAPGKPEVGYDDIMMNTSLCFKLREPMVDYAKGALPTVISIGSMMARPGSSLPQEYLQFMETAPEGVIYVSFGSLPLPFPEAMTRKLIDAFSKIKQKVIWREAFLDRSRVSANVKVVNFAPQVSILAHASCRLFITHGGVNSLIESAYHGVPMIAMPLALDQNFNAAMVDRKQYGIRLDIATFTSDQLVDAINRVLTGSYQTRMTEVGAAFRSLPPGGEKAVYWIDHVIKHGSGHLQPFAVHMPWYQYILLDVLSVFIAGFVLVIWLFYKTCVFVTKCCINVTMKQKSE